MRPWSKSRAPVSRWVLPLVLIALAAHSPAGAQGIEVALHPATLRVFPGAEFELELRVEAGSPFNGFTVAVSYHPGLLTLLPTLPTTLQQGCLMTGDCSDACGNTFHLFSAAADSAQLTSILLCNQISLTGPGTIYKLRFRAANTIRPANVRIRRAEFYNGGVRVTPVTTSDAQIQFISVLGVDETIPPGLDLPLRAEPNPSRGPIAFSLDSEVEGEQVLEIHDVRGRLVCRLDDGWHPAGVRRVTWDARDAAGAPVPVGIYFATLRAGSHPARVRVAVIR